MVVAILTLIIGITLSVMFIMTIWYWCTSVPFQTNYYDKNSFQLFCITQDYFLNLRPETSMILLQVDSIFYLLVAFFLFLDVQRVRSVNQLPVNLNVLKEGLSLLVLPSQTAQFTEHLYVFYFSFCLKKRKKNGKWSRLISL